MTEPNTSIPVPAVLHDRAPRTPHIASVGPFTSTARTAKDAREQVAANVAGYLAAVAEYPEPIVVTYASRTTVATVAPSDYAPGWSWREISYRDGGTRASGWAGSSAAPRAEAAAQIRYHAVQDGLDWLDDDAVHAAAAWLGEAADSIGEMRSWGPAELYRYAAWQRAARAAMDAGRDDWHEWATRHAADHAVPAPAATKEA